MQEGIDYSLVNQHAGSHEKAYCVGDPQELKHTLHSECDRMERLLGRKELFYGRSLFRKFQNRKMSVLPR